MLGSEDLHAMTVSKFVADYNIKVLYNVLLSD